MIEYCVELVASDANFGPGGAKLAELWDARNLGWSRFDGMPGRGFLTLPQRSGHLSFIEELETHVKVWRITSTGETLVYTGVIVDRDASNDDIVFPIFDYIALLGISRSGFKTLYPTKKIGTEIISPEWTLAKNASSSPVGFVATGTIEDPLGVDGVTPIKTTAQFGTLDQMRLQLFHDLAMIGRANTTNHTTFEITREPPHTFNFWKNRGSNSDIGFVLNGNVRGYRYIPNWLSYRNDLASVSMDADGGPAEITASDATAITAKGRRQDVMQIETLLGLDTGTTEADQQKAALQAGLKRALQLQPALRLELMVGSHTPLSVPLCDKPLVEISNGGDAITGRWRLIGELATYNEHGEFPAVLLQPVVV
jgi:hypothetical protein